MTEKATPRRNKLSSPEYKKDHPVAHALREAGFIPIPRYWIKGDDMPKLKVISDGHREEVNRIRHEVHFKLGLTTTETDDYGPLPVGIASDTTDDPRFSKDAAWEAFERGAK